MAASPRRGRTARWIRASPAAALEVVERAPTAVDAPTQAAAARLDPLKKKIVLINIL